MALYSIGTNFTEDQKHSSYKCTVGKYIASLALYNIRTPPNYIVLRVTSHCLKLIIVVSLKITYEKMLKFWPLAVGQKMGCMGAVLPVRNSLII